MKIDHSLLTSNLTLLRKLFCVFEKASILKSPPLVPVIGYQCCQSISGIQTHDLSVARPILNYHLRIYICSSIPMI